MGKSHDRASSNIQPYHLRLQYPLPLPLLPFLPPSSFPSASIPDDHNELSSLKAWPSLPSYLPRSSNPSWDPESCESLFGNGFTRRVDFLSRVGGRGWFMCRDNTVLGSSVCEGWRVRTARGGERLAEVIGRNEKDEVPMFEEGPFEVEGDGSLVPGEEVGKRVEEKESSARRTWRVIPSFTPLNEA